MSLSLMDELVCRKRARALDDGMCEWHVLIAHQKEMLTTVCYFGADIPNGTQVSAEQWDGFVEMHIANRLESFTLSETVGYWKGCKERTYVLTVVHRKDDDIAHITHTIADLYKKQFQQEAVLINTVATSSVLV